MRGLSWHVVCSYLYCYDPKRLDKKKLPEYIVKAIKNGTIIVCQAKDYEYLKGEIVNPEGTKISFL